MGDVDVYLDNPSKAPRNEESRQRFRQRLTQRFDKNLPEAIERHWELPSLNVTSGPYLDLLIEARDLFVNGYFYSCVAMCGIVGERLVKDMLRNSVLIEKDGKNNLQPTKHLINWNVSKCSVLSIS